MFVVGRSDAAFYFAPAKVTATRSMRISARSGTIAVEFEPSGPPERVHAVVSGAGRLPMNPEPGSGRSTSQARKASPKFTGVGRRQSVSPFVNAGCGATSVGEMLGSQVPGARLVARSATKKQAIYLQANQNYPGAPVYLETSIEERHAGLTVSREVEGTTLPLRSSSLPRWGRPAHSARAIRRLTPTFHRNAKPANRSTGNLTGRLPGPRRRPARRRTFQSDSRPTRSEPKNKKRLGKGGESRGLSTLSPRGGQNRHGRRSRGRNRCSSIRRGDVLQLEEAGLGRRGASKRVAKGQLHRIHRGVYAVGHSALSWHGRWMAAVLACGEGAVLSHGSAASHWGLLRPIDGPVHVSIPSTSGRKPAEESTSTAPRPSRSLPRRPPTRQVEEGDGEGSSPTATTSPSPPSRARSKTSALLPPHVPRPPRNPPGRVQGPAPRRHRDRPHPLRPRGRLPRALRPHRIPPPEVNPKLGRYEVDFLWRRGAPRGRGRHLDLSPRLGRLPGRPRS